MFNADLALSVTMTAISTLLSTVMLPLNLLLYAHLAYSADVVQSLDWSALFVSLVVVIGGISGGLISSQMAKSRGDEAIFHRRANLLGNIAGLALITLSITVSSTDQNAALWDQSALFYIGVALPALIGLGIATYLATKFDLHKPERVAVAVESCYQNTGIATSVALTMFSGNEDDLATAVGVPLFYGIIEAVMLAIFCLVCWKIGWTKAPPDENLCVVIYNSYEVEEHDAEQQAEGTVEVQSDMSPDSKPDRVEAANDLILEETEGGTYVGDIKTLPSRVLPSKSSSKSEAMQTSSDEDTIECSVVSLEDPHLSRTRRRESAPDTGESTPASSGSSDEEDEEEGPSRLTRTMAVIRARAEGYRAPPSDQDARPGPRIPSALTELEEVPVRAPRNYEHISSTSPHTATGTSLDDKTID